MPSFFFVLETKKDPQSGFWMFHPSIPQISRHLQALLHFPLLILGEERKLNAKTCVFINSLGNDFNPSNKYLYQIGIIYPTTCSGENDKKYFETTNWLSLEIPNWKSLGSIHEKKKQKFTAPNLGGFKTTWAPLALTEFLEAYKESIGIHFESTHFQCDWRDQIDDDSYMYLMNVSNVVIFHMLVVSVLGYRVHLVFFSDNMLGFPALIAEPKIRTHEKKKSCTCAVMPSTLSRSSASARLPTQRSCRPQFHG